MSYSNQFISVVIAAAGLGKRMKADINKQFLLLDGKPIVAHTIAQFEKNESIDEIIVVVKEDELEYCKSEVVEKYCFKKIEALVGGGAERQESVYNGLKSCSGDTDIVLIHDGVRPFITSSEIDNLIEETLAHDACVTGVRVKDTIKIVDARGVITETPDRSTLWAVHTPQSFSYRLILEAHKKAVMQGFQATDDSSLVENLGREVKMIEGSYDNIKITTPEDLFVAENILKRS